MIEHAFSLNASPTTANVQSRGIEFSRLEELPHHEALQLVRRLDQIIVPEKSPAIKWSLAEHRQFIAEYHACQRVTVFLRNRDISIPASHFGRLLPSVRYQRMRPCRYCGNHTYTRSVATHSELFHGSGGYLECDGCDAWIVLSTGESFGVEYSLQSAPNNSNIVWPKKSQPTIDLGFIEALFQRYVPEYQHQALHLYLAGQITLEQVQERTGILITGN